MLVHQAYRFELSPTDKVDGALVRLEKQWQLQRTPRGGRGPRCRQQVGLAYHPGQDIKSPQMGLLSLWYGGPHGQDAVLPTMTTHGCLEHQPDRLLPAGRARQQSCAPLPKEHTR